MPSVVLVVVLSPRSQDRLSGGVPVEMSVKVTVNGSVPDVGLAVNAASGSVEAVTSTLTVPVRFAGEPVAAKRKLASPEKLEVGVNRAVCPSPSTDTVPFVGLKT